MKLILDFLLIMGMLATVLILIILFSKKEKEFSHKVLLGFFIPILIVFISYYSFLHRIQALFYSTFLVSNSFDIFVGPLLFIYVKGITGDTKNAIRDNYVHFIFPVVYLCSISIPALIGLMYREYEMAYLNTIQPLLLFSISYSFGYFVSALLRLARFQKLVRFNFSNLEYKDLVWVQHLLLGAIVIATITIITSIYEVIVGDMGWDIDFFSIIPIVFLVLYLGYYGISQSKILIPEFLFDTMDNSTIDPNINKNSRPSKYRYDPKEMEGLAEELSELMEKEKPYLDEDLTLTSLSNVLDVPDKKLSTLLNQNMAASFYDYINGYRVEEVKRRMSLPDNDKYTLLAIAYDSGFKSKSSFNRIFKSSTKLSPSDYRKQLIPSDK